MSDKIESRTFTNATQHDPRAETWAGTDEVMGDLDEKRVLFQAIDSF